jgi:YfiH family protein
MFFSKNLEKFSNLKHCFFSKNNGVSEGIYDSLNCGLGSSDSRKNIHQNLEIVSKKIGIEKDSLFLMNQTHSNKVFFIKENIKKNQIITSDGLITNLKNKAIGVLTADCVPVLFYEETKHIIACVHAGWRGAFNGIIENTLNEIINNNKNSKIHIAIGPCLGAANYEVGIEFYGKFLSKDKTNKHFFRSKNKDKFFFNLREFVNLKFKNIENVESVENLNFDTFEDKEHFFSFRRSKLLGEKDYGRCISVISLA